MTQRIRSFLVGLLFACIILSVCPCSAATPITISEGTDQIRIVLLADDVVRIRVGPGGFFPNDRNPEFAVIKPDSAWPGVANRSSDDDTIDTGKLRLVFTHAPLALTVYDHNDRALISNYRFGFSRPKAAWDLHRGEHIYGFGDKKNTIDKRGTRMDIWNVDTDYQDPSTGLMGYKSIAMYWSSRGYGLYLHNWWRSSFDMGQSRSGRVEIAADGGGDGLLPVLRPFFQADRESLHRADWTTVAAAQMGAWVPPGRRRQ